MHVIPWRAVAEAVFAGLSQRRLGFDPGSVHVMCVCVCVRVRVELGQVFLGVIRFSPVSMIPPMLRTHVHVHVVLTRRTDGRSLGTSGKGVLFRKSGSIG